MEAGDWALLLVGLTTVLLIVVDVAATLVVTWGGPAAWRPTRRFYRASWRLWSTLGRRIDNVDRQQRFLGIYAPLSLLALLALWLLALLFGWSLVWMGLRSQLPGVQDFGAALYYSGVVLLTIGFGDITASGMAVRMLTLAEAATGLASLALVISYLPVLYGAYGRREARLLTLDLPSGDRITPATLIVSQAPDADVDALYRFFGRWEQWVAEVLESHTSYPMLAFFRSQHRGQSWITALGVVVDAAALTAALVPGAEERAPFFLYRRGWRAIDEISHRLSPPAVDETPLSRPAFDVAYGILRDAGLPLRPPDDAWRRLEGLRPTYAAALQSLFEYLVAPPGFWGHSAGDELTEPVPPPAAEGAR